jgi:K+-sensing histidine kinase KdpD
VFSRFYRGRGDEVVRTRGAGLGLSIVTEFASSMGGVVSTGVAPGGGARFEVTYPRHRPAAAPQVTAPTSDSLSDQIPDHVPHRGEPDDLA